MCIVCVGCSPVGLIGVVCCILCMVCGGRPFGKYFASLDAGMGVLVGFVGEAVQLAFPEGRLADVNVVGPVRRPPERRYSSIIESRTINDFIVLL